MSLANPLWGAPHIVGELSKIGITLSRSTVAKYMIRHRKPPSQTWKSFLKNHIADIAAVDFFIVPTEPSPRPRQPQEPLDPPDKIRDPPLLSRTPSIHSLRPERTSPIYNSAPSASPRAPFPCWPRLPIHSTL
jgi:hypothetical protein